MLAAGGCGDEEQPDDAEAIATVINEVRAGLLAEDGGAVCERLTEQGQAVMLRIAMAPRLGVEADSCEEAVSGLASKFTAGDRGRLADEPDYGAEDVDLEPGDDDGFSGVTATTEDGRSAGEVEVRCRDASAGSYFAVQEDGEWRLTVPFCSGR